MYQRYDFPTGEPVGEPGALPDAVRGLADYVLADLSVHFTHEQLEAVGLLGAAFLPVPPVVEPPPVRRLAKVDFWRRFTPAEQVALLGAKKRIAAMTPDEF